MSNDESVESARAAWLSQPVHAPLLSIAVLRERAADHAARTRTRSVLEYGLGATALVMGAWFAVVIESGVFRAGVVLLLAGVVYAAYWSWRHSIAWSQTVDGPAADGLRSYQQELARLRDEHRRLWTVHLPASVPGAVVLLAWAYLERPDGATTLAVAVTLGIIVMVRYEAQEASRYQRELDALEGDG